MTKEKLIRSLVNLGYEIHIGPTGRVYALSKIQFAHDGNNFKNIYIYFPKQLSEACDIQIENHCCSTLDFKLGVVPFANVIEKLTLMEKIYNKD